MTELLERALVAIRRLSPDEQDEIAHVLLQLTGEGEQEPIALTQDERRAIDDSLAAAARGEFATDEQVQAVFDKYCR